MKRILFTLSLLITLLLVTGCFFESVTSIRVVSGIKASWELDEEVDLHSIVIEVVVDGKVNKTVYGDTEGVSIVGLDMSSSGQKIATVSYEGVSVNVSYLVVGEDTTATNMITLVALLEDPSKEIITLSAGTYDFYVSQQIDITRSVVLRAAPTAAVVLKNVNVNIAASAPASIIEFRNVEFAKGKNPYNLKISSSRTINHDSLISDFDRVVLNNITMKATGKTDGIRLDGKTNFEMYNSTWVTPTSDDYFNYMMRTGDGKMKNNLLILEDNEFKCNFWYGLGNVSQAIIRGNLFEGTIPVDTHLRDDAYAPLYNVGKNPVVFHASLPTTGPNKGQLKLVVEDNTFKNIENLFRVYQTDHNDQTLIEKDLIFTNNKVTNTNVLVNYSANGYTKDVATVVMNGLTGDSQYLISSRAVLAQNTAISGTMGPDVLTKVGTDLLYKGLIYQEKDTSDVGNRYFYIGKVGTPYVLAKLVGTEVQYFTISLTYSADGLDTRTITKITDSTTLTKLETYRLAGHFTVTAFE